MVQAPRMEVAMKWMVLAATAALSACAPSQNGCGLLACITSPYLRAKAGPGIVGMPLPAAIATMGGAPTSTVESGPGRTFMTWTRTQNDRDTGLLSCNESLEVQAGRVIGWMAQGHCGV